MDWKSKALLDLSSDFHQVSVSWVSIHKWDYILEQILELKTFLKCQNPKIATLFKLKKCINKKLYWAEMRWKGVETYRVWISWR